MLNGTTSGICRYLGRILRLRHRRLLGVVRISKRRAERSRGNRGIRRGCGVVGCCWSRDGTRSVVGNTPNTVVFFRHRLGSEKENSRNEMKKLSERTSKRVTEYGDEIEKTAEICQ